MNKRMGMLLGVLGVLALVWLWFFVLPNGGGLQARVMQRAGQPVRFLFSRDLSFEEIRVVVVEPGPAGAEDQTWERVIWHLVPDPNHDEARPTDVVTYSRWVHSLVPAEGFGRRGERLEPGRQYRFVGRTVSGEEVAVPFSAAPWMAQSAEDGGGRGSAGDTRRRRR